MIDAYPSPRPSTTPSQEKQFFWRKSGRFIFGVSLIGGRETQLFELSFNPARSSWSLMKHGLMGGVQTVSSRAEGFRIAQESLSPDFKILPGVQGEE